MFAHSTPTAASMMSPVQCSEIDAVSSTSNSVQRVTNGASTSKQKSENSHSAASLNTQDHFCLPIFKTENGKLHDSKIRKNENLEILFDVRLFALVGLVAVIVIFYKMVLVTVPYVNTQNIWEATTYIQTKYNEAITWTNEQNFPSTLWPLICGLAAGIGSFALVYLDSKVPGVYPPSPFSPKTRQHLRQQRTSSMHLGYVTALAAGVVVFVLMYSDF